MREGRKKLDRGEKWRDGTRKWREREEICVRDKTKREKRRIGLLKKKKEKGRERERERNMVGD